MEKQIPLYSIELNGFQMRYTLTENELSSNIKHSNILELYYSVEDKEIYLDDKINTCKCLILMEY